MKLIASRCVRAAVVLFLPITVIFTQGCSGVISSGPERGKPTNPDNNLAQPPGGPGDPQLQPSGDPSVPGVNAPVPGAVGGSMPLRRLTNIELKNTLGDLVAVDGTVPETLPRDVLSESGFPEGSVISRIEADALMSWTGSLVGQATAQIRAFAPCAGAPADRTLEDQCATGFISNFGMRAFRRPLTPAEVTEFETYYRDALRTQLSYGFDQSIGALAHLMLQSPRFLYHAGNRRDPNGAVAGSVPLDGYELASRMSYLLQGTMPDGPLFDAAANGRLASVDEIQREARRLLTDPRSKVQIEEITLQWLGIEELRKKIKDPKYNFTPELGQAMVDETRRLVDTVLDGDGTVASLLLSKTARIDHGALAALYGQTGFSGNAVTELQLNEAERSGILTRAAFLTSQSLGSELNPIKRGLSVVKNFLCLDVPRPPAGFVPPDKVDAGLSTREFLIRHDENACAKACHALFTPPGFNFEHYDGVGAYRTLDGTAVVDATGDVYFPDGTTRPVADALQLSQILAAEPTTGDCVASRWFRRAVRRVDTPSDAAQVDQVKQSFRGANGNLRELLVALVTSTAFTHRTLESAK
ncbi:MAG: DUF1592 domain-containing protein [Polyangiaceae bacterium]|nr:DUF1592 domain-containing protein [Polyangiaceae bacterium]